LDTSSDPKRYTLPPVCIRNLYRKNRATHVDTPEMQTTAASPT
jgi:hypothetical protein